MGEELEILNTEVHRQLRMRSDGGGAHPHFVPIVVEEFLAAANCCPIFFAKDAETGEFYAAALFGFEPGELLIEGAAWDDSSFQPLHLQRQGFFTAQDNIAVDRNHPRFGRGATIALFDEEAIPTDALRKVQRALGQLAGGMEATRMFLRELVQLRLVEPVDTTLRFDDGQKLSLQGLYTVSRDRLDDLEDARIVSLFRKGYLQLALCVSFSLGQVPVLARRRNQLLMNPTGIPEGPRD
jgi:hypothetical protein